MLIGVNCTSPYAIPLILQLKAENKIDFCELMVDNFVHLNPAKIKATFADLPLSLHIVASHFLEKSMTEVTTLGKHLRSWIADLNPIYTSDHIICLYDATGKQMPMLQEFAYEEQYDFLRERIKKWQSLLETKIYFENHASLTPTGKTQADFFAQLQQEMGVGILFDVSNAYIAELNNICPLTNWQPVFKKVKHIY